MVTGSKGFDAGGGEGRTGVVWLPAVQKLRGGTADAALARAHAAARMELGFTGAAQIDERGMGHVFTTTDKRGRLRQ